MARKIVSAIIIILLLAGTALSLSAQEGTPEATPEATDMTAEATDVTAEATSDATAEVTATPTSADAEAIADMTEEATAEATLTAEDQMTHIRVAHFSPDAPAVDVYVNGELPEELTNHAYPNVSDWLTVEADGSALVDVTATDTSEDEAVISDFQLDLVGGAWITVAAIGSVENGTLMLDAFQEDYSDLLPGTGGITFYNAIEGSTPVNVVRDESVYAAQLTYPGSVEGAFALVSVIEDAGAYTFRAEEAANPDNELFTVSDLGIPENAYTLIAIVGTPDDPQSSVKVTQRAEVDMELGRLQEPGTLFDAIESNDNLNMLADVFENAGMANVLRDEDGLFTLFLPASFAFDGMTLPEGDALTELLQNHAIDGLYNLSDLIDAGSFTTLGGLEITITVENNQVLVNNAQIIVPNVAATNGVIHIINQVLMPEDASG